MSYPLLKREGLGPTSSGDIYVPQPEYMSEKNPSLRYIAKFPSWVPNCSLLFSWSALTFLVFPYLYLLGAVPYGDCSFFISFYWYLPAHLICAQEHGRILSA